MSKSGTSWTCVVCGKPATRRGCGTCLDHCGGHVFCAQHHCDVVLERVPRRTHRPVGEQRELFGGKR